MKDEHVLMLVGGGVGLYLAWRWREDGQLPQFQLPGLGGGVSLDLSNLLGGGLGGGTDVLGDLRDLLGGLQADDAAVRDFLGACLTGGGIQQGGDPRDPSAPASGGGGGGAEPSLGGGKAGAWAGPTGFVEAVGGTSPLFQAGVGVLAGGLGVGTGAMMVRTAPALGRAAVYTVEGAASAARSVGNVLGRSVQRILVRAGAQRTATQTAAGTLRTAGLFRPRVGPLSYQGVGAAGRTGLGMGVGSLLMLAGMGAASASTLLGRLMFGEEAPEKVIGWGLLSALSPAELLFGGTVSASEGEGYMPSATGGDVTPWVTWAETAGGSARMPAGDRFAGAVARAGVGGAEPVTIIAPSGAGASETVALRQYTPGVRASAQASLAGATSSGGSAPSGSRAQPVTATGMASESDERAYWSYT